MTGTERVKAELMLYAICNDYFGYGSMCEKQANGKYKAVVEYEKYYYTLKELAKEWENLDKLEQQNICDAYFNDFLKDN